MPSRKRARRNTFRGEDRFVVCPHRSWLAVALDGLDEFQDQCPARFVLERFEPKRGPTGVLQDGKDGVSCLTLVSLAGEVQAPNEVPRHGWRFAVLDSALLQFDLIPMLADQFVDKGSA